MADSLMIELELSKVATMLRWAGGWASQEFRDEAKERAAWQAEDTQRLLLTLPAELRETWNLFVQRLAEHGLDHDPELYDKFEQLFADALLTIKIVAESSSAVADYLGRKAIDVPRLEAAAEEIEAIRAVVRSQRANRDPALFEKSMADYAAGRHRSAREIYDELRRAHP